MMEGREGVVKVEKTLAVGLRRESPRGQKAQESRSPRPGVKHWGAKRGTARWVGLSR
jgi:hypothetical protein